MVSRLVSTGSALVLFAGGLVLLFGADDVLPAVAPGFPASEAWIGQLLAAAWLGVAGMNWLQRRSRIGGIYGRPVVVANVGLYFISALTLIGTVRRGAGGPVLWVVTGVFAAFAIVYMALMLRGPFDREASPDDGRQRRAE